MAGRKQTLPGKYSDEEYAQLTKRAQAHKMTLSQYVRATLGLPPVSVGAPKGNQNRKGKKKGE